MTQASPNAPSDYVAHPARPDGAETPARRAAPEAAPREPSALLGKVLPHSLEAEVVVLGSMMLDPAMVDVVVQLLQADDFYQPSHRLLYDLLVKLHNAGKPVDLVAIHEELKRLKLLDRVGGIDYLMRLAEGVPSTAHAEYHATLVRDKALLRSLVAVNQQIIHEAMDSSDEPREIVDNAEKLIFEVSSRRFSQTAQSLESLLEATFKKLEAADGSAITGVATGFHRLDELTAGLQRSDMIVVAARPSMGKTALAMNMAEHMAVKDGRAALVFSLEMSKEQLAMRFLASCGRFSSSHLRRGGLSPEDWTRLQMAAGELQKAPIFIDDSADLNILQLRAKARRWKASQDIQCIFVDYLQLMSHPGRVESRQQQIAEISRGLKAIARELQVPVVVVSQLNRGPEDRDSHRPRMSDLRESGAIEQDADVVLLIHREDYYHRGEAEYVDNNIAEVIIAKQRNGPTDTVKLTFLNECVRFENYASPDVYGA